MGFICAFLWVYIVVVFGRVILSWFPLQPGSPFVPLARILYDLTEPVMGPLRRVIPPMGMLDLSATVLIIGLFVVKSALGC